MTGNCPFSVDHPACGSWCSLFSVTSYPQCRVSSDAGIGIIKVMTKKIQNDLDNLKRENNTLSLLIKDRTKWKENKSLKQPYDGYASFIFIVNDGYEMRKWVSKRGEFPSTFLARILNEKQGANGMWQEYLLDELDLTKYNRSK